MRPENVIRVESAIQRIEKAIEAGVSDDAIELLVRAADELRFVFKDEKSDPSMWRQKV